MAGPNGTVRNDVTLSVPALSTLDLSGWNTAVVGGTGGIGQAIARVLAGRGANVLVVGQTFRDEGTKNVSFLKADLSLMKEARRVGRELPAETLDLLVLTTGIMAAPERQVTAEGLERDMAVSYLSRLAVLRECAPRLGTQRANQHRKPRVFVMGFPGAGNAGELGDLNAEKTYKAFPVHMNTVAGNESLVLDGATRYTNLAVFGLNPGLIKSNIRANFMGGEGSFKHRFVEFLIGLTMIDAKTYAEKITPVMVCPDLDGKNAIMFNQKCRPILQTPELTADRVAKFMGESEALIARVPT